MNQVQDENFICIQGWMINNLDLKGNELMIFAVIYGFSQDGESQFYGSRNYLAEIIGSSLPTIDRILKKLVDQDYIIKEQEKINNVIFNRYKVNLEVVKNFNRGSKKILQGVVKNFYRGSKKFLHNNNIYNKNIKENNIKENIIKENVIDNKSLKNLKNEKKFYGEFNNVFFTEEQYKKLKELFPKDYEDRIQRLDDYMQSSGKKYKDCLATIRNWARKEGYKFETKKKLTKEEEEEMYTMYDTSGLTMEEYRDYINNIMSKEEMHKILKERGYYKFYGEDER